MILRTGKKGWTWGLALRREKISRSLLAVFFSRQPGNTPTFLDAAISRCLTGAIFAERNPIPAENLNGVKKGIRTRNPWICRGTEHTSALDFSRSCGIHLVPGPFYGTILFLNPRTKIPGIPARSYRLFLGAVSVRRIWSWDSPPRTSP
jgi:hypothetical protein